MKLAGIICEYNPFHSGHLYHINETKKQTSADGIVAVMSGNFVQRGEAAIFDKATRAKAAVLCGADVVIELNACHAARTAELFASNAVSLLTAIPEVKYLSFGTELKNKDISPIIKAADILLSESPEYKNVLKNQLKAGLSFPAARETALRLSGNEDISDTLNVSCPNNILAVEYVKAIKKLNSGITPVGIPRKGAMHDSDEAECSDGFLSATAIRERILKNKSLLSSIPAELEKLYKSSPIFDYDSFEKAIFAELIKMPKEELKTIAGMVEGIENRIKRACENAQNYKELCELIKTKRYALSSIRRLLLSSYLKIYEKDTLSSPSYIKILDFSSKGREILSTVKKTASLPVIKNMTALKKLGDQSLISAYEKEHRLELIYKLYQKKN